MDHIDNIKITVDGIGYLCFFDLELKKEIYKKEATLSISKSGYIFDNPNFCFLYCFDNNNNKITPCVNNIYSNLNITEEGIIHSINSKDNVPEELIGTICLANLENEVTYDKPLKSGLGLIKISKDSKALEEKVAKYSQTVLTKSKSKNEKSSTKLK